MTDPAPLTPLEAAALEHMLRGEGAVLDLARRQVQAARIAEVHYSGSGFFITFAVDRDRVPASVPENFEIGDLHLAPADGSNAPAMGFILFIRGGVVDFLEGFTYGDPYPDPDWPAMRFSYSGAPPGIVRPRLA